MSNVEARSVLKDNAQRCQHFPRQIPFRGKQTADEKTEC